MQQNKKGAIKSYDVTPAQLTKCMALTHQNNAFVKKDD